MGFWFKTKEVTKHSKNVKNAKEMVSNSVVKTNETGRISLGDMSSISTKSNTEEEEIFEKLSPTKLTKEQLEEIGTQELAELYEPSQNKSNPSTEKKLSKNKPKQFISTSFPKSISQLPPANRPFRILAIDGGGVRGLLPATILKQLEIEAGRPISELFDLVAGTSTGAILAAMLTLPKEKGSKQPKFTAQDGISLYLERCPEIFKTTLLRRIRTLSGLASTQYCNENKRQVLNEYIGDTKISDLLVDILVPSFDIREGKPYFFKSSKAAKDPRCDYKLVDVLDATSSAPTFFSPHKVEGHDAPKEHGYRSFVDGALTANSPALCALAEAYHNYGADPNNTVLVSLGCGDCEVGVDHEAAKNWGGLSWAPFFPNVMLSSSVNTVNYQLAHVIPPKHYFRVQSEIPATHADIDNVTGTNLDWLAKHGAQVAEACKPQLKQIASILNEYAPITRRFPNRSDSTATPDTFPSSPESNPAQPIRV